MKKGFEWFDGFRAGEELSCWHAFDKYYRSVTYFALKILNDDTFAEDIVSDAFRKAWDARGKFDTEKHLKNFLYFVTRNGCISHLRSEKVVRATEEEWIRLAVQSETDSPLDLEHVQTRLMEVVFEKMNSLPGGDVLRMSIVEGKSTEEIAHALNTSENNVYILKSRALKALKKMLSTTEWKFFVLLFLQSNAFPAVDTQHDTLSSSKKHVASSPGPHPDHPYPGQTAYRYRQFGSLGPAGPNPSA